MAANGLTAKQLRAMLADAERVEARQAEAHTKAQALREDIARREDELRTAKATLAAFCTAHGIKRNSLTPTTDAAKRTAKQAEAYVYPDPLPEAVTDAGGKAEKSWKKAFRFGWDANEEAHARMVANCTEDRRPLYKQAYTDGRAAAERRAAQLETAPVAV